VAPVAADVTVEVAPVAADVTVEVAPVTADVTVEVEPVVADVAVEVEPVVAEVAETAGVVADVTVEVAADVVADVRADVGKLAACACRESDSMTARMPTATIAACIARRAMCRKIGWGTSRSRSVRIGLDNAVGTGVTKLPTIGDSKHVPCEIVISAVADDRGVNGWRKMPSVPNPVPRQMP
jgi:hypothetical protein